MNICNKGEVVDKGLDWNGVLGKEDYELLRRMGGIGRTVELPHVNEGFAHIDKCLSRVSNHSDGERNVSKRLFGVINEVSVCSLDGDSGVRRNCGAQDKDFGEVRREFYKRRGLEVMEGVVKAVGRRVGS